MTSEASLADINVRLVQRGHTPVPMTRFRPNLVLTGTEPHIEDSLAALDLADGRVRLCFVKACALPIPTIDQDIDVRDPDREPLETLKTYRVNPRVNDGVTFGYSGSLPEALSRCWKAGAAF